MCGFVGVYEYGLGDGTLAPALLDDMRDTLRHRGPDGAGTFVSEDRRMALATRRLAIVDPRGGDQPMFGPKGECLVFNGEIYNYPGLRKELERDGQRFESDCDTEVILHLYRRYGDGCVRHLTGMFAFALWDPERGELILARDPIGEKPLYWTAQGGRLLFGSEIKAMLAHPAVTPEVNDDQLCAYLTNLVAMTPATLFRGISKLPPGTIARCTPDGLKIERYWQLFAPRSWRDDDLAESAPRVRTMLERSVEARLMSDVPVGVLLSGGLDSTTLVAVLRERAEGMATFSVGFENEPELDERAVARRVAAEFGTEHHEIVLSEGAAVEFLPELVHHQDEPLGDPVCMPLHFVCGLARDNGVKVLLAGEGADELFWGYPRYLKTLNRWRAISALLRLPKPLRHAVSHLVIDPRRGYLKEAAEGVANGRLLPMHLPVGLPRTQRERVLGTDCGISWNPSGSSSDGALGELMFDTQEYEFGVRLPELLLMRIDRFSMSNSVEARVPFLDPSLVEYVYRLPLEQKLREGTTKIVMREAVAGLVPDWVLQRPKQGFGAPVVSWLQKDFGTILGDLIDDPAIAQYFDVAAVRRLVESRHFGAWSILNFALWHRYWIQGRSLEPLLEKAAGQPSAPKNR
jgi:asparagine synthase (glutamine-hydrolysing)